MLILLHGDWFTIVLALLFWAFVYLAPAAILVWLIVWIVRRRAHCS